jgi:hypothetical protein
LGSLKEKDYMGDIGKDGRILKHNLKKQSVNVETGLNWLSLGFNGGL